MGTFVYLKNVRIHMALQLLLIDDSELNLKLTELMLAKIDCHTDSFSDVREALRSVRDHDYDLVFMDYLMPDINGIEATRLIRSMTGGIHSVPDYYNRLPVIALTAEDDSVLQRRMINSGINDVLHKPFKLEDVCTIIDKWCGTSLRGSIAPGSSDSHYSKEVRSWDSVLPRIVGITEETLQDMLRVDRDGFLETLMIFTEDTPRKHARIDEALSGEDYESYCVEVHRIKGEASMIGAYSLSEDAAHLNELGKILATRDISPSEYEEKLGAIVAGTAVMYKQLDELTASADAFLTFAGRKQPAEGTGVLSSFSQSTDSGESHSDKPVDRDKIIRYISHAREALDNGDTALAKEWLAEIGEHIKK